MQYQFKALHLQGFLFLILNEFKTNFSANFRYFTGRSNQ